MHFYAWKKGLKTGMYYLRSQAATQAVQFTVEKQERITSAPDKINTMEMNEVISEGPVCTMKDGCVSCGS